MGCCGRGAKKPTPVAGKKVAMVYDIGIEGTSIVEYAGRRSSGERFTVYGVGTGTQYRVVVGQSFRADNRDLTNSGSTKNPGLLEMFEANILMFRLAEVQPPLATEEEIMTLEPESLTTVQDFAGQDEFPDLDYTILDGAIPKFTLAMKNNDYTSSELNLLWAYEKINKNRKTVMTELERLISG